jgi:hypothetical protein
MVMIVYEARAAHGDEVMVMIVIPQADNLAQQR